MLLRIVPAVLVVAALVAVGLWLPDGVDNGRALAFSWTAGALFGIALQKARFCFFCNYRDWFEGRDASGLLAILLALALGTLGYAAVLGSFVPDPFGGRLPPDAHVGPVSWVLLIAGIAFGLGMVVSGSCISAHLYRLGEGSPVAPFALLGTAGGFLLGFMTWNPLHLRVVADAPVVWLPTHLGYAGTVALQLGLLGAVALWLLRGRSVSNAPDVPRPLPGEGLGERVARSAETRSVVRSGASTALRQWFAQRWPRWTGGIAVGVLAPLAYLRVEPLGVTAWIGSQARRAGEGRGWLPERLYGLDGFAGCATVVRDTLLTSNGAFIAALVLGAWAAALAAGQFRPRLPRPTEALRGLSGGLLLGWGAMTALGCTVGTLLSGISAGALSGWVFAAAVWLSLWAGLSVQRRLQPA